MTKRPTTAIEVRAFQLDWMRRHEAELRAAFGAVYAMQEAAAKRMADMMREYVDGEQTDGGKDG